MTTRSAKGSGLTQRLAAQWIQELGLQGFTGHPEDIFGMPGLIQRIKRLCPATLGIIAAAAPKGGTPGRTCLYNVAQHAGVSDRWASGKEFLRCLARTAMAAEIFDQLGQPYEEWHERAERLRDEEFDRGMRAYVHGGSNAMTRQ